MLWSLECDRSVKALKENNRIKLVHTHTYTENGQSKRGDLSTLS